MITMLLTFPFPQLQSENDFVRLMLNAQAGEDIREETEEEESNWDTKQSTPQGGMKWCILHFIMACKQWIVI